MVVYAGHLVYLSEKSLTQKGGKRAGSESRFEAEPTFGERRPNACASRDAGESCRSCNGRHSKATARGQRKM